jgi:hypothetical protein
MRIIKHHFNSVIKDDLHEIVLRGNHTIFYHPSQRKGNQIKPFVIRTPDREFTPDLVTVNTDDILYESEHSAVIATDNTGYAIWCLSPGEEIQFIEGGSTTDIFMILHKDFPIPEVWNRLFGASDYDLI